MQQEKHEQIKETITSFICNELNIEREDIEADLNLGAYGMGSSAAVMLTGMLEDKYELNLSPLIVFDYPTISALTEQIYIESES
nr:acyl carrier protein [uncultured Methylophaga sp.]